jgi:hypothetical protein
MAVFKYQKLHLKGKRLSKWPNFGSGLHTNKDSWKLLTHAVKFLSFLHFARCFEYESDWRFFNLIKIYAQCLLIFQAESLKFNNTLFTPIFSISLVCACFKYEFMYLAIILKSFYRLNVEILAKFVFRFFEPF